LIVNFFTLTHFIFMHTNLKKKEVQSAEGLTGQT